MINVPNVKLNDSYEIPVLGFGTYEVRKIYRKKIIRIKIDELNISPTATW